MTSNLTETSFRKVLFLAVPILCLASLTAEGRGIDVDVSIGGGGGIGADVSVGGGSGVDASVSVGGGSGVEADVAVGGGSGVEADVNIGSGATTTSPTTSAPQATASVGQSRTTTADQRNLRRIFHDIIGAVVVSRDGDFVGQVVSVKPNGKGALISVKLSEGFLGAAKVATFDISGRSVRDGVVRLNSTSAKLQSTLANYR